MSVSINGTGGITFADASTQSTGGYTGFRNRIINGGMVIDQRNNGAVVSGETYIVDRWRVWRNQTYDIQQSTDAPSGFKNSLKVTKTSATQSTYAYLIQYIEGFNFYDMNFGTANAKAVTLSFWVKSSVTGTFTAGIGNATGGVGSVSTAFYPASYTITSANTWEYKTVTIPGQTSGTWIGASNAAGASVYFNFGGTGTATANSWNSGDVQVASAANANLGATSGATFLITGVQLEKGSVATPFEFRPYGTELALCQRYYTQYTGTNIHAGLYDSVVGYIGQVYYKQSMRAAPSVTVGGPNAGSVIGNTEGFYFIRNASSTYLSAYYASAEL